MTIIRALTEGNDYFSVTDNQSYTLSFYGGDDQLVIRSGTTTAYMGAGNDVVSVYGGGALVYGHAGADRFELYATARAEGGADNDRFLVRGGSSHILVGGDGDDRFDFLAGATNELLYGGNGNDLFVGGSNPISGRVFGEAGNDTFVGFGNYGGAVVTLYGGFGNDVYRAEPSSPTTIVEYAGQGTDTVQVALGRSYTLGANLENLAVVEFGTPAGIATLTGNGLDNVMGGSRAVETLSGMAGNDTLYGYGGNDTLIGGGGNDRIVGGLGGDVIYSGAGEDVIVYTALSDSTFTSSYEAMDWIRDWDALDTIDLSAIDANSTIAGNQAFRFSGYAFGFPGTDHSAGSLTIGGFGGELYIIGYVNNDDTPDIMISLWSEAGEYGLTVSDLIL